MTARYQLRRIGVFDAAEDRSITVADTGDWSAYLAWLASGNAPDPEPEPAVPRQQIIDALWSEIRQRRQACTEGGVLVNAAGANHWFHSDTYSRTQWLGMVILGASLPAGIRWKTMEDGFVTLTPTIVLQVFAALQTKEASAFAHGEALRAAIEAAADPLSVDVGAGWPAAYNDPAPIPELP